MGPYCDFCDRRCFVLRKLPDDARGPFAGTCILMATCTAGAAHDHAASGYTYITAPNPNAEATK